MGDCNPTAKKLYEGQSKCKCCINWVEEYPEDLIEAFDETEESRSHALLLRYSKSHKSLEGKALQLHSIIVQSATLKSVVQRVLDKYPGVDANLTDLTFTAPFRPFFHRWANLQEQKQKVDGENLAEVELLIDTLKPELERDFRAAADLTSHGNINFSLLWALFPPGCVVFGKIDGQDQCFLVEGCTYTTTKVDTYFDVDLSYLDYDGALFGWRHFPETIGSFNGTRKINELDVIPRQHHSTQHELHKQLSERGLHISKLAKGGHKGYSGNIFISKLSTTMPGLEHSGPRKYVEGRVIIDPSGHREHEHSSAFPTTHYPAGLQDLVPGEKIEVPKAIKKAPNYHSSAESSPIQACAQGDFDPLDDPLGLGSTYRHAHDGVPSARFPMPPPPPLAPPGMMFDAGMSYPPFHEPHAFRHTPRAKMRNASDCPSLDSQAWVKEVFDLPPEVFLCATVRGYCLTSKEWAEFKVGNIKDIQWNEHAYSRLVMSPGRKRLLKAMVEEQKMHKADLDDMIEGKGQGLVMLLSGPPGTGKTLTAESIADRLQMPLYALGASQLGDFHGGMEEKLNEVMRLAAKWNAVLLLDEADVFLERRGDGFTHHDRSKKTATFLRVLEYYKGVLIMTTNRPVNFDEAFYSRIHLTLHFPKLDVESRKAVWSNFLNPAGATLKDEHLEELARAEMNGRQIKNVVKMARLLATNEKQTVTEAHVKDVLAIMEDDVKLTEAPVALPPRPVFHFSD